MKSLIFKSVAVFVVGLGTTSCMTTYDRYGNPVQSVDPGAAAVGIVAAGLVGAAIANDNNNDYDNHYHGGYHHGGYHHY